MSTSVEYANNDILTDCVLPKGFKELGISCGDMHWILAGGPAVEGSRNRKLRAEPLEGTTAAAIVELENSYADEGDTADLSVSSLIIQSVPESGDSLNKAEEETSSSLGKITFKYNGNVHIASCLPFGRVKSSTGQVFVSRLLPLAPWASRIA